MLEQYLYFIVNLGLYLMYLKLVWTVVGGWWLSMSSQVHIIAWRWTFTSCLELVNVTDVCIWVVLLCCWCIKYLESHNKSGVSTWMVMQATPVTNWNGEANLSVIQFEFEISKPVLFWPLGFLSLIVIYYLILSLFLW